MDILEGFLDILLDCLTETRQRLGILCYYAYQETNEVVNAIDKNRPHK